MTRKSFTPLIFTSNHFRVSQNAERGREKTENTTREREKEQTSEIKKWRRIKIAILPSRDHAGSRSRSMARSREALIATLIAIAPSQDRDVDDFFLGCGLCFLDLCFPSSFPNTRKYFPEIFLKCNQTRRNIFLFRKLVFPENMYFPENVLQQPNTA